MIYVRIYEDRMDLLRAVIVGPAGTPYHNGLFFFDFHFPEGYPNTPPVHNISSIFLRKHICDSIVIGIFLESFAASLSPLPWTWIESKSLRQWSSLC